MSVFLKNLKILCLNIEISCFAGTHTTTKKMLLKTQIVFLRSDKIIIATQTLDYFQKRLICFKQITARKLKKTIESESELGRLFKITIEYEESEF